MNSENSCSITADVTMLETQTEANELKMMNSDNDELNLHPSNFSLPDNIYRSGVSNCTGDIQVGTRIITPNVFVLDQNRDSLNEIRNIINGVDSDNKNNNRIENYSNLNSPDSSKPVEKKRFSGTVKTAVAVLMIILGGILLYLVISNFIQNKYDEKIHPTSLQFDSTTISLLTNELFITQEKCGDKQGKFCDSGNLTIADGIKISYTSNRCDAFEDCCESLKYEKSFDVYRCSYADIHYHFTISENGEIYEGRRTECQIPLTYRDCNQSLLEIGIFTGRSGIICTDLSIYKQNKQIENLDKLIKYNQDKGVLSNGPLKLHFSDSSYTFCTEIYTRELSKIFIIQNITNYNSSFCDDVCS